MIVFVFPAQMGSPLASLPTGPKPGGTEHGARGAGSIPCCQGRASQGMQEVGWKGEELLSFLLKVQIENQHPLG